MNITKAEYIRIEGHPYLCLQIDEKEALVGEFKYSMLLEGCIPLRTRDPNVNWDELLPEIKLPGFETSLRGFTNHPVIIAMAQEYWKAVNRLEGQKFHEGPVPIPKKSNQAISA